MMYKSLQKIITFFLTLVMMVSAFGIAQVTHICTMESASQGKMITQTNLQHTCCIESKENKSTSKTRNNCCKNIFKYYQNKIVTIVNGVQTFEKIAVSEIVLFNLVVTNKFSVVKTTPFSDPEYPPCITGKEILRNNNTFLI